MKYAPFIIVGLVIGAVVVAVVATNDERTSRLANSSSATRNAATAAPSATDRQPAALTAQTDADGCTVIDLRGVPPTDRDQTKRVYTWVVEYPAEAPCVRQFNPSVPEPVTESRAEKIRGTNAWRHEFFY